MNTRFGRISRFPIFFIVAATIAIVVGLRTTPLGEWNGEDRRRP